MARRHPPPREAAPAARVVATAACLNVAFVAVLLAAAVGLSRLATGGDFVEASSAFPNNNRGEHSSLTDHGATRRRQQLESHEDDRCAAGGDHVAGAGFNAYTRQGYVDYLYLFYCVLDGERRPGLGYAAMAAWLGVLFYVLGDTAATYFCASLDGLARLLRLPPAIAGATLLSLGNGAPDALSAVASIASGGGRWTAAAVVGLSGVLGGAMFVSTAVLGVIGLRLGGQGVAVDRASFFRDAGFLLLALAAVAVVLAIGEINLWGAVAFLSIYLVYVLAVAFTPDRWSRNHYAETEDTAIDDFSELHSVAETKFYADQEAQQESLLSVADDTAPLLRHYAGTDGAKKMTIRAFCTVVRALDLFLRLPRQLTIPDASKERWSKPTAVASATLAPLLLSFLCRDAVAGSNPHLALLAGIFTGLALGTLAFLTTDPAAPPTRPFPLAAWLAGGFAMSVAWAYVAAHEALALLAAAGAILSVDAAALGVTVLAWGNSLGDLVTNVAVAASSRGGGGGGAQVAVSGCYGGSVFNVLVGLGLSLLLACWAGHPRPVEVPGEAGLYRTLGFVAAGVLWAAVVLHRRGMRVDRTLGLGLLVVYLCFFCVNISQVLLGPKGRQ
ncbi:hypothetical protein PR202_ga00315 [Eleusine coracana subsp. coracana]|uniref:Sodium/calcium exchanger membrane region domain-containing protein n=1 Tax=Eleusine coracana subsp. coracana TaxID=191504 RepID=A0AAV5BGR1_ELECO|nr:hypothetical protein QOZ80_2AG0125420 [Eleusine coracana subsp. coracana]GJM84627.1 hypothetical protein PR202_ga00315 [Eleusine coracana subsp. coracana]